jgi:hypothetical protein
MMQIAKANALKPVFVCKSRTFLLIYPAAWDRIEFIAKPISE